MSRLIEWSEYLTNEFGLTTRFVDTQSDDWARVRYRNSGDKDPLGMYLGGESLSLIRSSLWGTERGFMVMIHKLGHHLVYSGYFGYPGDYINCSYFVKKYWRKVERLWLLSYDPLDRREELVVQCFALWAMDWGDNHSVNKGFKDFLIWNGAAPPPF